MPRCRPNLNYPPTAVGGIQVPDSNHTHPVAFIGRIDPQTDESLCYLNHYCCPAIPLTL
jgi:hypothetical protein